MSDIKLNTDTLNYYGDQLLNINKRILEVNLQMKTLYGSVRLVDLGNLLKADFLADFSLSLLGCANYCYDTANEFNDLESKLANENPLDFNKPPVAGWDEFLYDMSKFVGAAVEVCIDAIESVCEAIDEAIQWIDEHGGEILNVIADVVTIAIAAAVIAAIIVGTGGIGVGAVIAIVAGIYALADLGDTFFGVNFIETGMIGIGTAAGTVFGNPEAGALIGEMAFAGSAVAVDVASVVTNPGKIVKNGASAILGKGGKYVGKAASAVDTFKASNLGTKVTKGVAGVMGANDIKGYVSDATSWVKSNTNALKFAFGF